MSTIMHCENGNHSVIELYSMASGRGKSLIVYRWCEICGGPEVVEMARGSGKRRIIVKKKQSQIYKQMLEEKRASFIPSQQNFF